MDKYRTTAYSSIPGTYGVVKESDKDGVHITVHTLEQLHDRVRQLKINRIYDILKPDMSR